MSSTRATKSGFAAEAQAKTNAKYEQDHAVQCLEWISRKTGEPVNTCGDPENFHEQLKNGYLLAKLANAIQPGSVKIMGNKPPTMAFKQMELIGQFADFCKKMGLDNELFQTVDLYESQNLSSVVTCITALGRKLGELGPKESKGQKREWTEEQMKAGQNIIGLQMGTNKGANQSGMNIGNTRHIVD